MKTLHLINKPGQPFSLCQRSLTKGDAILFIENGVYILTIEQEKLKQQAKIHPVYALHIDLKARGIATDTHWIHMISYDRFVDLTLEFNRVISWF